MKNHQKTWKNYHLFAEQRGELVVDQIHLFAGIENRLVLDVGCGDGGTSKKFAESGARVTAIDIQPVAPELFTNLKVKYFSSALKDTNFDKTKFDIIIMQDVLEHLPDPDSAIKKVRNLLSDTGLIYISTPNRLSILNFISDPHWNLPFVAIFSRKWVKLFVRNIFRKDRRTRQDWAALLSLFQLRKLTRKNQIEIKFINSFTAKYLFQKPESIICNSAHLKIARWIKQSRWEKWIYRIVNDKFGFFNYFINPTWYIIGKPR